MNKVDLYLLGAKGEHVLRRLCEAGKTKAISCVVAARDKGVDDDRFDAIKALAEVHSLAFHHKSEATLPKAKHALAVGWRWLIGEGYTQIIVLHDSLLPRYRGFNPLVSCLLNAEPEIGVTALIASAEYDRGPIIAQKRISITHPMKIDDAIDSLLPLYADLAIETVQAISDGPLQGQAQDESAATYSLWRDEADYMIDWQRDAAYLQRFVMAVGSPYAGARTFAHGRALRIDSVEPIEDVHIENRQPGKIIFLRNGYPVVVCGTGLLRIVSAYYEDDGSAAIPFDKLRTRFDDGRVLS